MGDITDKDYNIKLLLAKVSKEVNICFGVILHWPCRVLHTIKSYIARDIVTFIAS